MWRVPSNAQQPYESNCSWFNEPFPTSRITLECRNVKLHMTLGTSLTKVEHIFIQKLFSRLSLRKQRVLYGSWFLQVDTKPWVSVVPLKIHVPLNLSNQFHVLDWNDYLRQKLRSFDLIFFHRNTVGSHSMGSWRRLMRFFHERYQVYWLPIRWEMEFTFCTGYCMRQHRVRAECVCGWGWQKTGGFSITYYAEFFY